MSLKSEDSFISQKRKVEYEILPHILTSLHKQIWQKLYNQQIEEKKEILINREECGDVEPGKSLKQGNNPATYGIDSYKFYSNKQEKEFTPEKELLWPWRSGVL